MEVKFFTSIYIHDSEMRLNLSIGVHTFEYRRTLVNPALCP